MRERLNGEYTDHETKLLKRVVDEFGQTKSGVIFRVVGNSVWIYSPEIDFNMSDDELLVSSYASSRARDLFIDRNRVLTDRLRMAKLRKQREIVGGYGVIGRNSDELDCVLPGIVNFIRSEEGKVVFLGNGVCDVACEVGVKYPGQMFLVDMFDYEDLHEDFLEMERRVCNYGIYLEKDFRERLVKLERILEGIKSGMIRAVNCCIGRDTVPEQIMGAHLVVNVYGPPLTTLKHQLEVLAAGGKLRTNYHIKDVPHGFSLNREKPGHYVVKREETFPPGRWNRQGLSLSEDDKV